MIKVTIGFDRKTGYCNKLESEEDPVHGECFRMLADGIGSVGLIRISELRTVEQVDKAGD